MKAEHNELITRIGPNTPCGAVMRHYWHPVALVDEFNPAFDPGMAVRPVKAVRLLGQDLVLFKNATAPEQPAPASPWAQFDRDCPHRGADLAFARFESTPTGSGLRCPFHGWKFDASGQCIETPPEPAGSKLCERVRQRSYPVIERSGVLFAWTGPEGSTPPPLAAFDCFTAPETHTFAFKGLWACNWLQAFEVGIDPAHASFLHRFFEDKSLDEAYGRQFRGASAGTLDGERLPMTRVLREFDQPDIRFAPTDYGMQLTTLRPINAQQTHVRVTNAIFPSTFVPVPRLESMAVNVGFSSAPITCAWVNCPDHNTGPKVCRSVYVPGVILSKTYSLTPSKVIFRTAPPPPRIPMPPLESSISAPRPSVCSVFSL
jgi:phenylpropionate dioxygenase-like ring-hydroxylating dioxygenase large terminal subunit